MLLSATICPPSYYRAGWLKMQERDRSLKDQIAEGARQMRYQPENIRILGMVLRFPVLLFERRRCLSRDRSTIAAALAVHVHDKASAVKPCKTVSNPARRRHPAARKISCMQHAN